MRLSAILSLSSQNGGITAWPIMLPSAFSCSYSPDPSPCRNSQEFDAGAMLKEIKVSQANSPSWHRETLPPRNSHNFPDSDSQLEEQCCLLLLQMYFYVICMCVLCACIPCVQGQKRALDTLELELRMATNWHRSSARTGTLNCSILFPAPVTFFSETVSQLGILHHTFLPHWQRPGGLEYLRDVFFSLVASISAFGF